jgi:hypothetical protein
VNAPEQVLDKVRAILRKADVANNPSEAERDVALQMAQRLLFRHGLEMADVGDIDDTDDQKVMEDALTVEGQDVEWKSTLAYRVSRQFFCTMYYIPLTRNKQRVVIVGKPDNVAVVKELLPYIERQIEDACTVALSRRTDKRAQYARMYCEGITRGDDYREDPQEYTDEELAEAGQERMAHLSGPEQLRSIMAYCGIAENYAGEVRPFVKRGEIAAEVVSHIGVWRRSFYDAAVSRVGNRLYKMHKDQVEEAGDPGVALVSLERKKIEDYMNEHHPDLRARSTEREVDPSGMMHGRAAGDRADLSGSSNKMGVGQRNQLGSGE